MPPGPNAMAAAFAAMALRPPMPGMMPPPPWMMDPQARAAILGWLSYFAKIYGVC